MQLNVAVSSVKRKYEQVAAGAQASMDTEGARREGALERKRRSKGEDASTQDGKKKRARSVGIKEQGESERESPEAGTKRRRKTQESEKEEEGQDVAKLDLGSMSAKRRCEVTYGGYPMDVIKSALQKYVRRGMTDKAVKCAIELDLYSLIPNGRRLQTNLWNRLKIIALEDVSLACVNVLLEVDKRMLVLEEGRQKRRDANGDKEPTGLASVREKRALIEMAWMLAASKHVRLPSHYNAAFSRPQGIPTLKAEAPEIHKQMIAAEDSATYPKPAKCFPLTAAERADKNLVSIVERLTYCLEQRWDAGFIPLRELLVKRTGPSPHRRSTNTVFLALDLFHWFITKAYPNYVPAEGKRTATTLIEAMARWCKTFISNKEGPPLCLRTVYLALVLSNKIDWKRQIELPHDLDNDDAIERLYKLNLKREALDEIDEFAVDMHTRQGRNAGKGREVFALEGSVVANEDNDLVNPLYKKLYLLSKGVDPDAEQKKEDDSMDKEDEEESRIEEDDVKEDKQEEKNREEEEMEEDGEEEAEAEADEDVAERESELFEIRVRAQLVTSMSKQDTYYATIKKHVAGLGSFVKGQNVFVKGPFAQQSENAQMAFAFNSIKEFLDGMDSQKMYLINLIPDLQLDSFEQPIGYRTRLIKDGVHTEAYPFLVYEDLFDRAVAEESESMPIRTHSSKCWPATQVTDYDRMARDGLLCTLSASQLATLESVEDEDLEPLERFILVLCFRHAFQIPDCAARNFLWIPKTRQVFSVDEDATTLGRGSADSGGARGDKLVPNGKELAVIQRHLTNKDKLNRLVDMLKTWKKQLKSKQGRKLMALVPDSDKALTNLEELIQDLPALFRSTRTARKK